jgi:hypothetical protein
LVVILGGAAWWGWTQLRSGPTARPIPIDPGPWITRQAKQLCADPKLIEPSLAQRKQQFSELLRGTLSHQELLDGAPQDPLGALIAWSKPTETSAEARPRLPGSCPSLEQALARQWRSLKPLPTVHAPSLAPSLAPAPAPAPAPATP